MQFLKLFDKQGAYYLYLIQALGREVEELIGNIIGVLTMAVAPLLQ